MHYIPLHASSLSRLTCSLVVTLAALMSSPAKADDYEDALGLMRAGKYAESLTKADALLASKPKDAQMLFIKGSVLQAAGQQNEALALFTKLTEDHPELPEPYNNMAVILAAQNQFEKARIALEMAIRNKPDYATAYENLGDVHAKLASHAYGKASQFNPAGNSIKPKQALISELFKAPPTSAKKLVN
jgi:tetratricopeptide (TPR) repeat protein